MRITLILFCLLALPAAAGTPSGITVTKPWMRYLLPSIPAGGYLTLQNSGDNPAILTGAASPSCGALMLHETQDNSGMAMMMSMPTVTVPPHGSVSFAPGGYHLMCMAPKMKVGDQVPVTLTFQDGTTLPLTMRVYSATTAP